MPGNFTKANGDVVTDQDITADLWNTEFDNVINNATPDGIDDASTNVTAMQATRDPYPLNAESLATSLREELQSLRYMVLQIANRFGPSGTETKWYADIPYLFGRKGTDIASAAALVIPSDGNYFHVTGTTTITSIGTKGTGSRVTLVFDGAVTITHNGTSLILPEAANILTVAGDVIDFVEDSTGNWRLVGFQRKTINNPSTGALTFGDDGGNAFTSATSTWSMRYEGGKYYRLSISGGFITGASSGSKTQLRISGLGIAMQGSATAYVIGGFVKAYPTGEPITWDTPLMISGSEVAVRRFAGTNWGALSTYIFTLEILVPVP